jgi:hypothetical protein
MMIDVPSNNRTPKPPLPAGDYVATLDRIEAHPTEEETAKGVKPAFGPYLKFVYKVTQPQEHAGRIVSGICSLKRDPRSKLAQILPAFGKTIDTIGAQLDPADLVGKEVRLKLEKKPNKEYPDIVSVTPLSAPANSVSSNAPLGFKSTPRQASAAPAPAVQAPAPVAKAVAEDEIPF